MGLFKTLKLMKDGMKPAALKQGLASAHAGLTATPGPTPDQLRPRSTGSSRTASGRAARSSGPRAITSTAPLPSAEAASAMTVQDAVAQSKEQFMDVLRNPFGARKPPPPPGAPTGPVDRERRAAVERAARDAAREPYLAPERAPLSFSRLATRRKTQLDEVAAYLGSSGLAAHPDLVYGIYRVPDHIGGGKIFGDGDRVVEWDVVHAAAADLGQAAAATAAVFGADEPWVRRRDGEPAVLDEDLALAYLERAGIGPEQCLGISRFLEISHHSGSSEGSTSYTVTRVTGVHAFHPRGLGAGAFDALRSERPLLAGPMAGVHTEVLNWGAIARAIHPETHHRHPPVALPPPAGTPQELLRAYVEIVGVRPGDCYSAR